MLSCVPMAFRYILPVVFMWFLYHPSFNKISHDLAPASLTSFFIQVYTVFQQHHYLFFICSLSLVPLGHFLPCPTTKNIFSFLVFINNAIEAHPGNPACVSIKECRAFFLSVPLASGVTSLKSPYHIW